MRLEVTLSQSLNLPDDAEIVDGPGGQVIKVGDKYFLPRIEVLQSREFDPKRMSFEEMDEESADLMIGAISHESCAIVEF